MKIKTKEEKASSFLFVICFFVYMIICMTKSNYSASISYIVKEGIFTKSNAGIISSAFYLLYGISQIFGGCITDRISPFTVMKIGIVGSVITNFLLMFSDNFYSVLILWSITGLIQFGVWSSIAKIVAGVIIPKQRRKAAVNITLALALGAILSYLIVNLILEKTGWWGVFGCNVIILIIALVLWIIGQKGIQNILTYEHVEEVTSDEAFHPNEKFFPLFIRSGLVLILLLGVGQALLDNGVKSWIPTIMMERYGLSPAWASMQVAILYFCNIFGVKLLVRIFGRIRNAVLVQTIYYLICLPVYALLLFIGKIPVSFVLLLLIISTTAIYGMTSLSVRVAMAFERYGYSATVSGIINGAVCFGVVIAHGGYGIIADHFGWNAVSMMWLVICVVVILIGIPTVYLWKKFLHEK